VGAEGLGPPTYLLTIFTQCGDPKLSWQRIGLSRGSSIHDLCESGDTPVQLVAILS
jgi:hypothetical protein